MSNVVSRKLYWIVKVGAVTCESSSLRFADTATIGVDWEAIYTYQVHTSCGRTWSRESKVGEAYGLADSQSVKKPIDAFLVLSRPFLNALTVVESITRWSRLFHLSMTRSQKKWRLTSRRHLFFAILAEWPLVGVLSLKVNMLSKLITDHPLYILNAVGPLCYVSSSDHNPRCSNLSYDNCLRSGIIPVNLCWTHSIKCLSLL